MDIFFWVLVLKHLVGLHKTIQLQLLQRYWLGHRLWLLWYWMVCLGNEQRSFCRFWIASKYCISDSFFDHDGYSISSEGFLPAVVDIMVIWVNNRRRQCHRTPVLLPGKSHGWRSLVGCSPWGREESDMTERLPFHSSLSCIGEGNGNPLQRSCLENPRDGEAWLAAVYGVTQSQTRLKRLSSSSRENNPIVFPVSFNLNLNLQ